ncbi:MAG: peptidoglycan D,D-transpeptidase FtsI family protein [Actinomycetota bacterium]
MVALFVVFTLAFGGMATRLMVVQVRDGRAYARLAREVREREIIFPAQRGAVYDRGGDPLAISVDLETVYADPTLIEDPASTAEKLAGVLNLRAAEIVKRMQPTPSWSRYEVIARQLAPKVTRRIKALELVGIAFKTEPKRLYPNKRLASHVLGSVNNFDAAGAAGIELEYDGILRGDPGLMVLEEDPTGRALPQTESTFERPRPGRSLYLTIDKDLQHFTELTLAATATQYHAESATAIVMRPRTGEILALDNVPDFDPNAPGKSPAESWRNRALTDMYEPGSAYKIVTASAALEEGVVTPRTTYVVPDALPYADRVFNDSHPHPTEKMTVTEIIRHSSNVGTIKIGLDLGGKKLDEYVRRFGFGARTGLDFPGESPGIVIDRESWSGTTIATIPMGQGIAVTPMQMAVAYSALANDGVSVEPKLLYATMDGRGKVRRASVPATRRIVSTRTARRMVRILTGVVEEGTGIQAQIPGYLVAGKTGTAQKPLPTGGYGSSYVASFAGFAPARDPEVMTIVVLDNPSPIWGGLTAAPAFRTITEFALRHLGVPPTGNAEKAAREIEASVATQPPPRD